MCCAAHFTVIFCILMLSPYTLNTDSSIETTIATPQSSHIYSSLIFVRGKKSAVKGRVVERERERKIAHKILLHCL